MGVGGGGFSGALPPPPPPPGGSYYGGYPSNYYYNSYGYQPYPYSPAPQYYYPLQPPMYGPLPQPSYPYYYPGWYNNYYPYYYYNYYNPYYNSMCCGYDRCWCGHDFWSVITGGGHYYNGGSDDYYYYGDDYYYSDDDGHNAYLPDAAQRRTPAESFDPDFDDPSNIYDENAFGLGFFAAIVIAADNVDLYLDGYSMEQSPGHALIQRWYAHIELASTPFISDAGPAQFVGEQDELVPARNVRVLGPGVLGLSSHHGTSLMKTFFSFDHALYSSRARRMIHSPLKTLYHHHFSPFLSLSR